MNDVTLIFLGAPDLLSFIHPSFMSFALVSGSLLFLSADRIHL